MTRNRSKLSKIIFVDKNRYKEYSNPNGNLIKILMQLQKNTPLLRQFCFYLFIYFLIYYLIFLVKKGTYTQSLKFKYIVCIRNSNFLDFEISGQPETDWRAPSGSGEIELPNPMRDSSMQKTSNYNSCVLPVKLLKRSTYPEKVLFTWVYNNKIAENVSAQDNILNVEEWFSIQKVKKKRTMKEVFLISDKDNLRTGTYV